MDDVREMPEADVDATTVEFESPPADADQSTRNHLVAQFAENRATARRPDHRGVPTLQRPRSSAIEFPPSMVMS